MQKNIIVCGLAFGDEGKGSVVDYLTYQKQPTYIIRYNGGSQAAHNVVFPDGREHCFSQVGSGIFHSNVKTILTSYMYVDPLGLLNELEVFASKSRNKVEIIIDSNVTIVTPYHKLLNQIKEYKRNEKHGSCGVGVGEVLQDILYRKNETIQIKDLLDKNILYKKLKNLHYTKLDIASQYIQDMADVNIVEKYKKLNDKEIIEILVEKYQDFIESSSIKILSTFEVHKLIDKSKLNIFEGAQGTLLDMNKGFFPYVSVTDTTVENAYKIIDKNSQNKIYDNEYLGLFRAYFTRHGKGPFVTEDKNLINQLQEKHNVYNIWQENMRVGWLDLVALDYSLSVNEQIDYLALTNIDRLLGIKIVKIATQYQYIGEINNNVLKNLQKYFILETNNKEEIIEEKIIIKKIKYIPHHDLENKQCLTDYVFNVKPIYQDFLGWDGIFVNTNLHLTKKNLNQNLLDYINFIEDYLKRKVKILSYGNTYENKLILS